MSSANIIRRSAPATALPLGVAMPEGIKTALLTILVYLIALPFVFFAGAGFLVFFIATAWLLGREYFELAAMRFRSPAEAKAMRKDNAATIFTAGLFIAAFVSIPIVNLATPLFGMAFMVHMHKRLSGPRPELIEPARKAGDAGALTALARLRARVTPHLPQHQVLREAERRRRERARRRAGDQGDDRPAPPSPARSTARSRRYRRARWPRAATSAASVPNARAGAAPAPWLAKLVRELLEHARHVDAAVFEMLAEIIGMDLLAHAQPGAHQRHADLGAAEPHDLDIGGERRRAGRIGIGQRDDDDRQQRECLPDRLQQHDADEIAARPVMGQLRSPADSPRRKPTSPTTSTERASKCRSRKIETGTSTNIGSAP